jgi:ubiquinol-cytochrome c reductase iron-sulfur subunit
MKGHDQGRGKGRGIVGGFGLSAVASLGLTVVYGLGGDPQLEGLLLCLALAGLAVGLILWAKQLMPGGPFVEERRTQLGEPLEREAAIASFEASDQDVPRRSFLLKMLGAALGALGVAAVFPIRSLGAAPGRSLLHTSWAEGIRLVTVDGQPVRPEQLDIGGVLTVFPEGHTQAADSQTLLIRLEPDEYEPPPGRQEWSPQGFVAFSKVCTHAGCPVGLYQPETQELFCPCHQSVFAVLQAAAPTSGPATRPLPQLPLRIDAGGYLSAASDFDEPIGPGFWSRPDA